MPPARPPRAPRPPAGAARASRKAPPILARQVRGDIVESVHRGHVVRVDATGRVTHVAGDAEAEVALRSCVKPFALVALAEAGGFRDYGLTPAEIALMASSHSGEDIHVRTLQAVFRRSGLTQTLLACGSDGAPLDPLTSARLARDGEKAGPIRHMCSGLPRRDAPPRPPGRLDAGGLLGRRPPGPGGGPRRRRPRLRDDPGAPPHGARPLRGGDLCRAARRGRARLRAPRRSRGDRGRRSASQPGAVPARDP